MSYRTCVEGIQIFGNNCSYNKWCDFLKSEGIEVDEDGCYDGYITNFDGAIDAIERCVLAERKRIKKRYGIDILDLSRYVGKRDEESLTGHLITDIDCGYAFMSVAFFMAVRPKLEFDIEKDKEKIPYSLRDGERIHVHAG